MTQLRFVPATFAASAVFLFSSLSSAILPLPPGCGTGPACSVGFECTVVSESGCASASCPAGATCPPPEPCVTTQEMGCTLAHCSVDAECAPGMVCHAFTQACAVSDCACAPNTPDCGCGASSCDPSTVSMCTPKYLLPCKAASDCGDGFTCEEQMTGCATAGSGSSAGPTPGGAEPAPAGGAPSDATPAPLPVPAPDCSPQPTGQFQCVAKQLMCATAAQCPAGWSCFADAVTTSPACPPGATCASDPAPAPSLWCHPPYYGSSGGLGVDTSTTGAGPGTPPKGGTTNSGNAGGSAATAGTAAPEAAPVDDASAHESAACQLGHAPASSGLISLVTLLGALFGLKRRRAPR